MTGKKTRRLLIGVALAAVALAATARVWFRTPANLLLAAVTHRLPSSGDLVRIRHHLLRQNAFTEMLAKHEQEAIRRHVEAGVDSYEDRHVCRVNPSAMGLFGFYDDWATWVRTDIVDGRPLTSFLVRPGVTRDDTAETFFAKQTKQGIRRHLTKSMVRTYHAMLDWGVFKGFWLNITESDETTCSTWFEPGSPNSGKLAKEEWSRRSAKMHVRQRGVSFSRGRD